jgi:ribosome-binding ATPase
MSLSIGIVGLPNVGKSTLFNALLKKQVALAANYPFATIEPNVGICEVPDARLKVLAEIVHTSVLKPAVVEVVDIAGLVRGAATGEGLGNKFLAHIREVSAICHVLRSFTDNSILREGAVSPEADLATIRTELQLADLETLDKQKEPKAVKTPDLLKRWQAVQTLKTRVSAGQMAMIETESDEYILAVAKELCLLTAKREIFVINVDESEVSKQAELTAEFAKRLAVKPDQIVIVSAKIESELSSLTEEDQQLYLADLGLQKSGLERLAEVAYHALNLQSFLTAGELEVKAWTITQGMKAPEAAGVIHTDFAKNFIKAKVASYADFVAEKGWNGVREKGKLRLEGKDYVMQEGDIVEFMIGK